MVRDAFLAHFQASQRTITFRGKIARSSTRYPPSIGTTTNLVSANCEQLEQKAHFFRAHCIYQSSSFGPSSNELGPSLVLVCKRASSVNLFASNQLETGKLEERHVVCKVYKPGGSTSTSPHKCKTENGESISGQNENINDYIVRMICSSGIPFSIVDNKEFRELQGAKEGTPLRFQPCQSGSLSNLTQCWMLLRSTLSANMKKSMKTEQSCDKIKAIFSPYFFQTFVRNL